MQLILSLISYRVFLESSILLFVSYTLKEEKLRGRPGYEHLNEPLHILIEADLPASIVDIRLRQAHEIIQELLKPVVYFLQITTFTSC